MLAPQPFEPSRHGGTTTIWWRAAGSRIAVRVIVALGAMALSALAARQAGFSLKDWVFAAALGCGALYAWYRAFLDAFNRITLTLDARAVRVTTGPFPGRGVEVPVNGLERFVVRDIPGGFFYRVNACSISTGDETTVGTNLSNDDAERLAATLNSALGVLRSETV